MLLHPVFLLSCGIVFENDAIALMEILGPVPVRRPWNLDAKRHDDVITVREDQRRVNRWKSARKESTVSNRRRRRNGKGVDDACWRKKLGWRKGWLCRLSWKTQQGERCLDLISLWKANFVWGERDCHSIAIPTNNNTGNRTLPYS